MTLLRRLWDRLDLGTWIDEEAGEVGGLYRPSLMVELWIALLWFGGGWMSDLKLLAARGIRRIFGWTAVPDPTTFGRWLRRAGPTLGPLLDRLLWKVVRARWGEEGPASLTVALDSTVSVRYGEKQAGAETGYNPKKPGRPSHHPLLAFAIETGDCLGVRWRDGSASAAAGATEWLPELVRRLQEAGVSDITIRLDKGFYDKKIVEVLQDLEVSYLLKVPARSEVRAQLGPWRESMRAEGIFEEADYVRTATGRLWGGRLLGLEGRRRREAPAGELSLELTEITTQAYILTDQPGIHALTGWRLYNQGARVENRIKELKQLKVGQTAIDDRAGNALLWKLGTLAYQLLHTTRRTALTGAWKVATPDRLRDWLLKLPATIADHARKMYLRPLQSEPLRGRFLKALRKLGRWDPPPMAALG